MEQTILNSNDQTISVQDCQDMVNGYMQREKGTEDVDLIQNRGGEKWLFNGFQTTLDFGITDASIPSREDKYGNNKKEVILPRSWWYFAWEAFGDLLLRVLFVAGIVSIIIEMSINASDKEKIKIAWIEGFAILIAVAVIIIVTATNNLLKDREFTKLNDEAESGKVITIMRNGKLMIDVSYQIPLVGDILILKSGMEVPADCVFIEGFSIQIDESSVTGESKAMNKFSPAECVAKRDVLLTKAKTSGKFNSHDVPSSVILAGTKVLNGSGKCIVINVGKNSAIGKINELVGSGEEDELTPLQLKLEKLARDIAWLGLTAAVVLFVAALIKWIVRNSTGTGNIRNEDGVIIGTGNLWKAETSGELVKQFFGFFLVSVTILVVAIPEGLPLAVTLALAFAVSKMMKENNLVRTLAACETMGGANVICSDKTGTLTKNEMYFTDFFNEKEMIVYETIKAKAVPYTELFHPECQNVLIETLVYNSIEDPTQKRGNPTEMALLKYVMMCGIDVVKKREEVKKVFQATFTSDRKRMSTVVLLNTGSTFALLKGASEYVLETCSHVHDMNTNEIVPLTPQSIKKYEMAIEGFAKKALRTIGLAYKDLTGKTNNFEDVDAKGLYEYERGGFTLIGICGIKDVIRPEVPDSINRCRLAGIDVKMVTGDNKITAYAIAKEVGIINERNEGSAIVMEGPEFLRTIGGVVCGNCLDKPSCDCVAKERDLEKEENKGKKLRKDVIKNQEVFNTIWPNLCVLARSRPEDKYALVTGIKNTDQVVAVTGDGTNDAPALSKASVGFAMNIAGTEVAKNAADILLMDDNFASIIVAVKWGRHIYVSIQKFLQLQLTVTVVAVVMTYISELGLDEPIFSAVQMLWTNLVMDTLAALALATEPPNEEILKNKPVKKNDYMITLTMFKHIIGQAIYQIAVLCIFVFIGQKFLIDHTDRTGQRQEGSILILNGFKILNKTYGMIRNNEGEWVKNKDVTYSVHAAYNFNVFICMTYFNFVNCRVIDDSFNIFFRIHKSLWFFIIMIAIAILQILFVTFTGPAIKIAQWGLHPSGWGICIAVGLTVWIVAFLLKLIPTTRFDLGLGSEELNKDDLRKMNSLGLTRRSHNDEFYKRQVSVRHNSIKGSGKLGSGKLSGKLSNRMVHNAYGDIGQAPVKME